MFIGATPVLALGFAPIVAWVLSLDFEDSNSPWLLMVPAGLAVLSGYLDNQRSVVALAVVLSTFAWCIDFAGVLWFASVGKLGFLPWAGVELAAIVWFAW